MPDFFETFSINNLGALRRQVWFGAAENDAEIAFGVYLSWDPTETQVSMDVESPDWAALRCGYSVSGTPRWLSLNLALGTGKFEPNDIIGVTVEGYADDSRSLGIWLRSRIDDEMIDTSWGEAINLRASNDVSVALHRFEPLDAVVGREGFHTLVMALPPTKAELTLRDIRLFRVSTADMIPDAARDLDAGQRLIAG
jgi:hypothetical protein